MVERTRGRIGNDLTFDLAGNRPQWDRCRHPAGLNPASHQRGDLVERPRKSFEALYVVFVVANTVQRHRCRKLTKADLRPVHLRNRNQLQREPLPVHVLLLIEPKQIVGNRVLTAELLSIDLIDARQHLAFVGFAAVDRFGRQVGQAIVVPVVSKVGRPFGALAQRPFPVFRE